jgi:DNA-directed RNA polymerase specialized sigma24 family protein
MTVDISKLQTHKSQGNKREFNVLLNNFLPHLRKMVRRKLRQMEWNGDVPRNMYSAQGIVDEVYLRIFEAYGNHLAEPEKLKIRMYAEAREVLDELKEKHHGEVVSVETLLAQENKELQEDYTVDADGDLVMIEELDDISYHADDYKDKILLLENEQIDDLADSFELSGGRKLTEQERKRIGKTYTDLPELSRSGTDHFVSAGLTETQIAEIQGISVNSVREILQQVIGRFRKLL